jgi:diguanylate cyclase (GGDEF)-like protein
MAIEHNKDLHIELLRDELILTREELAKRFRTHDAFKSIVSEMHSTIVWDELKTKTKEIIEGELRLKAYALIVWDSGDNCFIVSETKGMTKVARQEALESVEAQIDPPDASMIKENDLVYLPLSHGQTTYGALCVPDAAYRGSGTESGEVLHLTVNQLTKAIGNAVAYEAARQLCVTDDKTMVYNHRYLVNRLNVEIKRAKRFGHQITCLMIDIDDFKDFNDTYGHLAGDDALKELAATITRCCRDIDILARFGGEEFSVLLPETGVTGGAAAADRIIKSVGGHGFPAGTGREAPLTVSIGVACYPFHAEDGDDLLKQSDIALYRAKTAGKNRYKVGDSAFGPEEGQIN